MTLATTTIETSRAGCLESWVQWAKMSEIEYAWAAGFMDGEGCFFASFIERDRGTYTVNLRPLVSAAQISRAPLERLQGLFGGHLPEQPRVRSESDRKNARPIWLWQLSSSKDILFLCEKLLPHLTVKKEQAEIMRRLCLTVRYSSRKPPPPIVVARRSVLVRQLTLAKQ